MRPPKILLAYVMTILMTCSVAGVSGGASSADSSWTIMVYMANDSTNPLPSEDNINAMEAAEHAPGTNVIVLLDEPGDGNSNLMDVQHDNSADQSEVISEIVDDGGEVIGPTGEVNTGDSATLANFVKFSVSHWQADRYVLILWGHGAGWDGLCLDGADILTLVELKAGLLDGCATLGRPLDVIAVDACVEATVETLYQVRECAHFFVAAQTNIPFQGLPYYRMLSALAQDPDQDPSVFGSTIVDEYISWSALNAQNSATMAVFDLAGMEALTSSLTALFDQGLKFDSIFHSDIHSSLADAEHYDTDWTIDLGDFLIQLSGSRIPLEMKSLAADAFAAYSEMVTHFGKFNHPDPLDGIAVTNSTGAIIYAPSTSPFDARYQDLDLTETNWDEFGRTARLIADTNESDIGPMISYGDSDSDGWPDQATLSWEGTYTEVTAWAFRHTPGGMTLIRTYESDTNSVMISGIAGVLMVSASASVNGSAVTSDALSITLYGTSNIDVRLLHDGEPVFEGYDVRVVSTNLTDYAEGSAGVFRLDLTVPTQVTVGQLVQIEVLDNDGVVVYVAHAFVPESSTMLEVEIISEGASQQPDFYVLLLFSVLPGLFVLSFSVMLYLDFRKKRGSA